MAGRCTECGMYHYDGPPCDNCGEMGFTEAPKVMECAECGEVHLDGNPPCDACGEMGFRRVENPGQYLDDGKTPEEHREELREFTRENGGAGVDRRTVVYGLGAVGVLGAGYYAFTSSDDYPTTEAPGQADEAAGIRFETVEAEMRGLINDERGSRDRPSLSTAGNVDAFAEYYNKEYAKTGGGNLDAVAASDFSGKFNVSGYYAASNYYGENSSGRSIDAFGSASSLARDCFESWRSEGYDDLFAAEYSQIGLDVHVAPDGDIFLLAVVD